MTPINSGPFIRPSREQYLEGRVRELKEALDLAQQRIDDLETASGLRDDTGPIRALGFSPHEARFVNALVKQPSVNKTGALMALYAEDPDKRFDVQDKIVDTYACVVKGKLRRLGVTMESIGHKLGWRITGPGKARLARLVASGARCLSGLPSDMRCDQARQAASRRALRAAAE